MDTYFTFYQYKYYFKTWGDNIINGMKREKKGKNKYGKEFKTNS